MRRESRDRAPRSRAETVSGIDAHALTQRSRSAGLRARSLDRPPEPGLPRWQLVGLTLIGSVGAAAVGYLVSQNPDAAPAHVAAALRVALISTLMATGIYCLTG